MSNRFEVLETETYDQSSPSPQEQALDVLSVDFPEEVPANVMFPEELNKYLQDQIRGLTQENGQLRRCLEECGSELQRYIEKGNMCHSGSRVSEMTAGKIKELSKRIRDLTAEMEGYKNKCKMLEAKTKEDQDKPPLKKEKVSRQKLLGDETSSTAPVEGQIQLLNEKLSAANIKLCESRNQCQQLKQELKIAQKALSNEIGESVSIHSLASGSSNWRGRAQQIITLQQKVTELLDRIKELSGSDSNRMSAMKTLEKERKVALEQAERNHRESLSQLDECKKKMEAVRSRNKFLEAEVTNLKNRLQMLLEKSSHDDQLIKTFNNQLALQERKAKDHEEQQHRSNEMLEQKCKNLQHDLLQEKTRTSELQTLLSDRDSRLEKRLMETTNNMNQRTQHRHSSRPGSQESDSATCRSPWTLSDQQTDSVQYQILGIAAEAERVRLLELLSITNRRMEEQRRKTQEAQDALVRERKKCARLELKLARSDLDKISTNKAASYRKKYSERELATPDMAKLELLQEEVCVLRTRLQNVTQEREDDLKNYANLLNDTRNIFLTGKKEKLAHISLPPVS